MDKEVNIGQKAYDFPMVSQAAFKAVQNTLILLNKNLKIYESFMDKEVNIGQKAYDFPRVSQAAFGFYKKTNITKILLQQLQQLF